MELDCGVTLGNVLSFGGMAYISLLLALYLRFSSRVKTERSQLSGHGRRALFSGLLLLVHLVELAELVAGRGAAWLGVVTALFAWAAVQLFYLTIQDHEGAGLLWVSSLLYLCCGLARGALLYSLLEEIDFTYVAVNTAAASSSICYVIAFNDMATIFNEMKENGSEKERSEGAYKQEAVHWYSRLTFYWMLPLLRTGWRQPLQLGHLGRLPLPERADTQFELFTGILNRDKGPDHVPSLWKCYFQCYWKDFFVGGIFKLICDLVGFVAPLGISTIIEFITDRKVPHLHKGKYLKVIDLLENGYVMAGLVFVTGLAQGTLSQFGTHLVTLQGIRLKTALQALVYDKALRLSVSSTEEESASEGKIGCATNLLFEDAFNVMTCLWIGHYTWAIPWKVALLMYLLYHKLGFSAVLGALFCVLIMTPLQILMAKKISKNSKIVTGLSDDRLRLTNELLQGMRQVKLSGWEGEFSRRLSAARDKELAALDRDSLYAAITGFLTQSSVGAVCLVTLWAHEMLGGSPPTPAALFSALALFNQLAVPLAIFPLVLPIIASAIASTKRLEDFLGLPETVCTSPLTANQWQRFPHLEADSSEEKNNSNCGLKEILEEADEGDASSDSNNGSEEQCAKGSSVCIVREAGFSWGDGGAPAIRIDRLNIPKGRLTAVIGRVGSGKSSFLCALLGEMKSVSGLLKWEKGARLAYVPQQPWLVNATVRDNILLGLPYRVRRYAKAIEATALEHDLQNMPLNDLTEVGERGLNLSGGQRQRVAIARAFYSKANVIILDDPLSSLDNRVAEQVFEKGILPLVARQKRSVIMVTHSVPLLTHADLVVTVVEGRVRASRKLRELSGRRSARERWQLVRLLSRIGGLIGQSTRVQRKPGFEPLRLWSRPELCWDGGELALPDRAPPPRPVPLVRAASLQTHSPHHPVSRQASTPNTHLRSRAHTYEGGVRGNSLLKQLFITSNKNLESGNELPTTGTFKEKNVLEKLISSASIRSAVFNESERRSIKRLPSMCSDYSDDYFDEDVDGEPEWCESKSVDDRQYGKISPIVYIRYVKACGTIVSLLFFIFVITWQAIRMYTDFWLSDWAEESSKFSKDERLSGLTVYTALSLAGVVLSLAGSLLCQFCGSSARRVLHRQLLGSVLTLPMATFQLLPLARVLARFSTDLNFIDKKLASSIQRLMQFLLLCCSAILVNAIVTPWFLIVAIPICIIYYIVQKFYRSSSRELQRLDSLSRTPILSQLTESMSGLATIRAFGQQRRFRAAMFHKIDVHTNAFLIYNCATSWLGIALDYLGAVIVLLASLVALLCNYLMPEVITPALVGLAINYTLLVPIYLNWVVKFVSDVEMYMSGVERIVHFIKMRPENYKTNGFVPRTWPSRGEIRYEGVSLRHDHSPEVAVTNVKLRIKAGQKIGICGRTGSGKSSLVMSLFGMVPIIDGSILIDGVDITMVPLQILRTRLSIIPQDIMMFSGTIRENLDLENRFSDDQIWNALEMTEMKEIVSSQLGGLNGLVREGGVNVSSGQKQLLSLARAILQDAAVLVMDEATSSLDPKTERKFRVAVEKAFSNKTVITIAHRLEGLLTCDRVLVLEAGRVVEDGPPGDLLHRTMGLFSTMLRTNR